MNAMSSSKGKIELLQTLRNLKRSASKIQKGIPASENQDDSLNETSLISFNKEFKSCLKELVDEKTEEAKKNFGISPKKKDNPNTIERTVNIIDKISIDDVLRQYKHDYGNFFQYKENNPKNSYHIRKSMLKILEKKRNIDEEQRDAMKELCRPYKEISNLFCDLCNLGPMTAGQLNRHNNENHEEFKKVCCKTEFNSYHLWNIHNKQKHKISKCEICNEEFSDRQTRIKHKRKEHLTGAEFTCTFCGKKWKDPGNFKRHIRQVHTDMKPFKCQTCERTFSDKGNLNRHIKSKHEGKREQCPHCSQTCSFGTLQRHIRFAHKKEIFNCPKCDKDFRTKYGLSGHINEKHKMVPTEYKCQICGKGDLFSPQARVVHKRKEHSKQFSEKKRENKAPQYECSFCPEQFDQKIKRKRHEINIHKERKSYRAVCDCGITALTEKRLEFHKERFCMLNSKAVEVFRERKLEHLRKNKNESHPCPNCDKAFTYPSELKHHIKVNHERK